MKRKKQLKKRILAFLLAFCMLGTLGVGVYADEIDAVGENTEQIVEESVEVQELTEEASVTEKITTSSESAIETSETTEDTASEEVSTSSEDAQPTEEMTETSETQEETVATDNADNAIDETQASETPISGGGDEEWLTATKAEADARIGLTSIGSISRKGLRRAPASIQGTISAASGTRNFYGALSPTVSVNGQIGYCLLPWSRLPDGITATFQAYSISSSSGAAYQIMAKLMYYSTDYDLTHFALGKVWQEQIAGFQGENWYYAGGTMSTEGQTRVANEIIRVQALPAVTGTLYYTMLYQSSGEVYQDIGFGSFEPEVRDGYLKVQKSSSDTSITNGNSNYSLAGAVFTVYSDAAHTKVVGTLTTDANGTTGTIKLEEGTYYVKETSAPKGYELSDVVNMVSITADNTTTTSFTNTPTTGYARVLKISSNTSITDNNSCYSLEGAVYGIYKDEACTTLAKTVSGADAKLTTKADGSTDALEMPLGNYWVKEISASKNYKIDTQSYPITIVANTTQVVTSKETPGNDPIGVMLYKVDSVTGTEVYGEASLENAQYTVKYYDVEGVTNAEELNGKEPWGTWVFKSSSNGRVYLRQSNYVGGDKELSFNSLGNAYLPIGTITVQETKAPDGYLIDETIYTISISMDENENITIYNHTTSSSSGVTAGNLPDEGLEIKEQAIRGDLEFNKKLFGVDYEMNNVTFTITNVATGESHDIVTDESGYYSTSSDYTPHTWKTNSGKTSHCGVWFGYGDVDNEVGALPYGDYIVTEKDSGKYNYGTDLQKGIKFSIGKDENGDSNPEENGKTVSLGVIENKPITITTEALSATSGTHTVPANSKETVVETVTYTGLTAGREYVLKTSIVDYDTQDVLTTKETAFTPTSENGTVEIKFDIEATKLAGKQLVIFEKLYDDGSERQKHESLADKAQTLYIPTVETSAADVKTTDDTGRALKDVSIIDHVTYTSVEPGVEYTVKGTLMDKSTGKAILDAKGKEITSSATFTPEETDGTVDVTFTFNGVDIEGKTTVVFESLYYEDVELAVHADLTDAGQTVYIPKIRTSAADIETKDNVGKVAKEVSIVDTVSYSKLIAGNTYTLKGTIVNTATGETVKDVTGNAVTASTTFTAKSEDGTADVTFTFDSTDFAGESITVYEELYYNDVLIAQHKDISDKTQIINYPKIGTKANDSKTEDHVGTVGSKETFVDTVSYTDLVIGKEYTITGTLMVKETGEALTDTNGDEITASKTITADKKDGSIELEFTFDSSLVAGKTIVAFEYLEHNKITVDSHTDITDEEQSVHYPEIKTFAADYLTGDHVGTAGSTAKIIDTIEYKNLIAGQECTIKGYAEWEVIDGASQDAGENTDPQIASGTHLERVNAEVTFTPENADGSIDLTFDMTGYELDDVTVSVTEMLYHNNVNVDTHEGADDENQQIHYPGVFTHALDSKTGSKVVSVSENTVQVDAVYLGSLVEGEEYTFKGTIINRETGQAILVDGKEVTAEKTITADAEDMEITLSYSFDARALAGVTTVIFTQVYHNGVLIYEHNDIDNDDETLYIPKLETTAIDADTKNHAGAASSKARIIDTVKYENLVAGREYTISGKLMVKESGEPLLVNGAEVVASTIFTADESDGSVELEYIFDSSALEGKTIVVFEDLIHEDVTVYSHADITDEDQSVHYPLIRTSATVDGKKKITAGGYKNITDTVSCENLVPGVTYTIKGTLMIKETGKSAGSTAEATFTADAASGDYKVVFNIDTTSLENKTLVVFEKLYVGDTLVVSHEDLTDEAQAVFVKRPGKITVTGGTGGGRTLTSVKTGDNTDTSVLVLLLAGAITFAAAAYLYKRKREKA